MHMPSSGEGGGCRAERGEGAGGAGGGGGEGCAHVLELGRLEEEASVRQCHALALVSRSAKEPTAPRQSRPRHARTAQPQVEHLHTPHHLVHEYSAPPTHIPQNPCIHRDGQPQIEPNPKSPIPRASQAPHKGRPHARDVRKGSVQGTCAREMCKG